MAENTNPYAILGVPKGITEKDLKSAYVNLVKKYDPEKHTERFMVIQAAYDRLRVPKTRAKEDLFTYNGPKGDYLFNADEKCADNVGPNEQELTKARADFRDNPTDEAARKTLLNLLSRHAHHFVVRKQLSEALRDWQELLEIEPTHSRARQNLTLGACALAYSYALHGLFDESIELWERALQINPDGTEVMHNLALACEKAEQHAKAGRYWAFVVDRWKQELEKDKENEYLRQTIVEALQHHGDYVENHPEANAPAPKPSAPSGGAPRNSYSTAPPPAAPSAPAAPAPAGASSSAVARPAPPAGASPAPAPSSSPNSSTSLRKVNIPAPAATPAPAPAPSTAGIDRYREIASLKPDDFDAAYQLCTKLMEGQLYEEALAELSKLSRKHPKNVEVLNMMGWCYLYSGKKDEGFNCWKRSMAIDPKNAETRDQMVRAHLSLGRSFRTKGMFTQALVHFKQLLTLMPRSVEVHMEIAATYDMKGDVRSAANEYARVLEIDPKHKDARKAMNDLRMKR